MMFKRFRKHITKLIACILMVTLLFTSLPMDGIVALAEQIVEESKIIKVEKELEQYRTEFSKTYLKSDGTLEAVVSATPIHFKEDGKWVEIDSTLETAENEKGEKVLKNKKGPFDVEFPEELQNGSEVKIKKDENEIYIKLLDTKKSKAQKNKEKKEKAEKLTKAQRKRMTAGELFEVDNNQNSALEYSEVFSYTNIRYDVTPNEVKESIVLQKAPNKNTTYSYEIIANGLTAVLNEDNSIDFYKGAKTEESVPVFSMPAPYMFDSVGEYSYDIITTLENKKGKYILTYKPNYEWLKSKERAYPVTIDPTIMVNSGIQAAYTYSAENYKDRYLGFENQLKVGNSNWQSENDLYYTYLKFTDLPLIPHIKYQIDSAYLMLTPGATAGTWEEMELGVYELTEDWKTHKNGTVTERITYNNSPADVGYSTATASVSRGGADNQLPVGFEIRHIVEKWYKNSQKNFGVKIAAHLEEGNNNNHIIFYRETCASGTAPYISLIYTEVVQYEYILAGDTKKIEDKRICSIEDTSILSTDGEGNITGLKPGTTKMYVDLYYNLDWPTQECTVVVLDESEFNFYNSDYFLHYGETYNITNNPNVQLYACDTEQLEIIGNNKIKPLVANCYVSVNVYYCGEFLKTLKYYVEEDLTILGKPSNNRISVGQRYEYLSAISLPSNRDLSEYAKWSSSDESIAKVYYDMVRGYVVLTGISEGVVTIFAEIGGRLNYASFVLTVGTTQVDNVFIDCHPIHKELEDGILYVGEVGYLKLDIYPYKEVYYNDIEWFVSDGDETCIRFEADADEDEIRVYASKPGKIEISVMIDGDPTISDYFDVEIRKPSSLIKVPTNRCIRLGTSYTFEADIMPDYAMGTWASSKINVGTISSDGVFTALSCGKTEISLSYKVGRLTHTHTFGICVSEVEITKVPGNRVLFVDGIRDLDAKVYLNNSTSTDVVWTTSNSSIATVNSSTGEITGKNAGKVTITAKYKNDTSKKAWVTITVKKTKSYLFYLNTEEDNWELNNKLYAKLIANKVYGANKDVEDNIVMHELESPKSFCDNWNNMGKDCDIGYVLIDCHASPFAFGKMPNNGSISASKICAEYDEDNENQLYFEEKEMCGLISFGCNSGHLDHQEDNLANALAKKVNGAPVLASDGTVFSWLFEEGEDIEDADDWNKKMASRADDEFLKYCVEKEDYKRTTSQGWVIYIHNGNLTRTIDVTETEKDEIGNITALFIVDMIEILSHY